MGWKKKRFSDAHHKRSDDTESLVITADKLAAEALHKMEKHAPHPITVLPVVDKDGKSIGMVHVTDLLRQGVV